MATCCYLCLFPSYYPLTFNPPPLGITGHCWDILFEIRSPVLFFLLAADCCVLIGHAMADKLSPPHNPPSPVPPLEHLTPDLTCPALPLWVGRVRDESPFQMYAKWPHPLGIMSCVHNCSGLDFCPRKARRGAFGSFWGRDPISYNLQPPLHPPFPTSMFYFEASTVFSIFFFF